MTTCEMIQRVAFENSVGISEVYEDLDKGHTVISVEIRWGDWKHDHLRFDYLMQNVLHAKRCESVVVEEDGSDCYSAIHIYYF